MLTIYNAYKKSIARDIVKNGNYKLVNKYLT